jgi:hypothetical protein
MRNVQKAVQFGKYFVYRHAVALAAGAVGTRDTIGIDGESDFELRKISVLADNRGVNFQMILTPLQEAFQSLPSFLSHYGSGQRPFIVNPAMILKRSAQFTGVFDDRRLVQVGTNNIVIAYHGAKVYNTPVVTPRRYQIAKPYIPYLANFTAFDGGEGSVPANATRTFNIRTDSDSDYEVQKITICSDGPILIQITTDQDNWFRNPLPGEVLGAQNIETVAGGGPDGFSGEYPFVLPAPRFVTAAAYISTEVTDLSGAANRVQVGYHGVRLYPAGGQI